MSKLKIVLICLAAVTLGIFWGAIARACKDNTELAELRGEYNILKAINEQANAENEALAKKLEVVITESEQTVADKSEEARDALAKARDVEKEKDEWKKKAEAAEKLTVEYEGALENSLELAETEIEHLKRVIDIVGIPEFTGMVGYVPQFEFQEGTICYELYLRGDAFKAQKELYKNNYEREQKLRELCEVRLAKTEKAMKWSLFGSELGKIPWFILGAAAGYGIAKLGVV